MTIDVPEGPGAGPFPPAYLFAFTGGDALVSLELAVLFLERGRTSEVRAIAEEMLQIFQTQKIEREALAALRLFCDAARREAATVGLARRLVRFLQRAQHDPELRFPADETEA